MPSALQSARQAIRCGRVIVFFDGYCNLCDRMISALLRADEHGALLFAPLAGETAMALEINPDQPSKPPALCVLSAGGVFYGADAIAHLCNQLPQPLRAFKFITFLPSRLRNRLYRFVADNRYAWFGRRLTCRQPVSYELERFLP